MKAQLELMGAGVEREKETKIVLLVSGKERRANECIYVGAFYRKGSSIETAHA